jgi:hypothetical protein
MQDRPTAIELLQIAQEFCEKDLQPALTGRVRFHARVLQNVLAILERELAGEDAAVRAEWDRLNAMLGDDGSDQPADLASLSAKVRERNTELGAKIRAGDLDDRFDEVLESLRATVAEKLAIANPRWSETRTY